MQHTLAAGAVQIVPIERADVVPSQRNWEFSRTCASEIDLHWRRRTAAQPSLFNGEILLLDRWSLVDGCFRGECLTTDFKSFLYWRDHGAPDRSVLDYFGALAIWSEEGWLIVGRMAPDHSNAGMIYMPCGSLDPDDVVGGFVDMDGNMLREVKEETGLVFARTDLGARALIFDGCRLTLIRSVRSARPAAAIVDDIQRHLARTREPELSEVIVVKGAHEVDEANMAAFTIAYIRSAFA